MPTIVVVGAGVAGLTSALLLSRDPANTVTVVAKDMPGDYDVEYTSPWAGSNYLPMADEANSIYERRTYPELKRLAMRVPEAGIHLQKSRIYRRRKDLEHLGKEGKVYDNMFLPEPWFKNVVDDYRDLRPDELPAGIASGCEFGSVCINTALYLPWLVGQCRAGGVVFRRANLAHVLDAASLGHGGGRADVVVNATALGAAKLGGVEDALVTPIRGQVVVVRNESARMAVQSGTDDDAEDVCYVMTRAAGGGTILGGTFQVGRWDGEPDPAVAERIMRRAVRIAPELTGGRGPEALDVVRHGVGLRPYRKGGVRLEKERMQGAGGGTWVVHNYGHAGWGYQGSYGCAERVVELVREVEQAGRAKL